jgi:hypothetical protein
MASQYTQINHIWVVYLEHVVCKDGIKPNPKVIESVKNWKTPETVKEVQKYLGLCSYYRRYVPQFSEKASPLSSEIHI